MRSTKYDKTVGLKGGLDQLPQTGNAKAIGQVIIGFALPPGFIGTQQSAPLRGGNAHYQIDLVLLRQFSPLRGKLKFVIGRRGVFERMVNAVVVKKHPKHFMPLRQSGLDEPVRGMPGIGSVRAAINLYGKFHLISWVQSHHQYLMSIILAEGECN